MPAVALAQTESFQGNGLFSLPRSQDDVFEWRTAREELAAGKTQEGVERLHALLESKRGGVVPVLEGVDRYLGLRAAVIETLRDLPPEASVAYERLVAREGGGLLRDALTSARVDDLTAVAHAFPTAEAGRAARLRLGDLEFVAGRPLTAMRHYLSASDATSPSHPSFGGIQRRLDLARALAEGLRTGEPMTKELAELVRQARVSVPGADDAQRDHFGFARRPPTPPRGQPQRMPMHLEQIQPTGFSANDFAMHVVGDASGLFVTDGLRVLAIDPFARERLWEGEGPFLREDEDYREVRRPDRRELRARGRGDVRRGRRRLAGADGGRELALPAVRRDRQDPLAASGRVRAQHRQAALDALRRAHRSDQRPLPWPRGVCVPGDRGRHGVRAVARQDRLDRVLGGRLRPAHRRATLATADLQQPARGEHVRQRAQGVRRVAAGPARRSDLRVHESRRVLRGRSGRRGPALGLRLRGHRDARDAPHASGRAGGVLRQQPGRRHRRRDGLHPARLPGTWSGWTAATVACSGDCRTRRACRATTTCAGCSARSGTSSS